MSKLWLVIKREYLFNLKRPAFLFAALGTPLFFIGIFVLTIVLTEGFATTVEDLQGVGYVDQAGVISDGVILEDYPNLFVAYETEEVARDALDSETINAYFVIPENYLEAAGEIQLYSYNSMPEDLQETIRDFLLRNVAVMTELPVTVERLVDPFEMRIRLEDSGRELTSEALPGLVLFPLLFAVVFIMATQVTSGFLMGGLVEEKSNRVIEILVTSVTPIQLLAGKIIGLALLGLTQLVLWVAVGLIIATLGQDIPFLSGITLQPDLVIVGLAYFILGYFMVASLLAALGTVVGTEQESRQLAVFVTLPLFVPYFFLISFFTEPNGTAPVILSLIPLTAPMAMIMRMGLTAVPFWHLALSLGLLIVTTLAAMWVSVKVFRWGLLLYGKKFNLREVIAVIRGNPEPGIIPTVSKEGAR